MWFRWRFAPALLILPAAVAQHVGTPTDDLDKLSVDELFNVQVTSVGRKAQELSKAPAAVFVLTSEDIRRSGATCIPEALEWVPGLTVLRLDGRSWVVSARGGARLYADKMLVMVDGASLYTPTFSGVIWDAIDIPMEEIERIEVVRGPGAVMWGPNAVNGVINIITRSAGSTARGRVSQTSGNETRDSTEASWSAPANARLSYKVWGTFSFLKPGYGSAGYSQLNDDVPYAQAGVRNMDEGAGSMGFRLEGAAGPKDQWMVQGSISKTDRQDPAVYPILLPYGVDSVQGHTDYLGEFLQVRWTRTNSPGDESTLQFSLISNSIDFPYIRSPLNTFTLDYQKRLQTGERNEIYWGAGFQQYWDSTSSSGFFASFSPAASTYRSGDVVVRDEYQLVPDRLAGSVGIRLDYNSFSHFEYQPSVRLLYTPNQTQSAWIAASRAVRVPSRINRDIVFNGGAMLADGMPVSLLSYGSPSMRAEVERSLEAGYRVQSGQRWSVDASVFWSYYDRLAGMSGPPQPVVTFNGLTPVLVYPLTYGNMGRGRSYGAEIWAAWQVRQGWRLLPTYSYLSEDRWLPANGAETYEWDTPLATGTASVSVALAA
ncbi:MAG TPA: TonB-dependent receptor plug domain-containing protein [Bryobacteraceae bacterium]|nr:TonB-dependent receptor plug domain-containing protein [Bryobacteraceae bacterium]